MNLKYPSEGLDYLNTKPIVYIYLLLDLIENCKLIANKYDHV